jgi:tetratricopeptide (TPR) repeat protein
MYLEQFDMAKQYALECLELDRLSGDMVGAVSALNILANVEINSQIAETYLQEALTIARQLDIPMSTAFTMNSFADLAYQIEGDLEKATFHYNACLKFSREYNQRFVTGISLSALSQIAIARGHYDDAYQFLETCIVAHTFPPSWSAVLTKLPNGLYLWGYGDHPAAVAHFLEVFSILRQSESRQTASLSGMPFVLAYHNQHEKAVALTHALMLLHPRISYVSAWYLEKHAVWAAFVDMLKAEIGDAGYQKAWESGEGLNLEKVIQELVGEFLVESK